jgi:phenylacetate-CoA ligase
MMALAHGHRQRVVLSRLAGKTFGYRELTVERLNGTGSRLRQFYELHTLIPGRIDFKRAFLEPSVSAESFVEAVNSFRPHVIRGYGSFLGEIFRQVYRRGLSLALPRIISYGGDGMEEKDRRLIEDIYKVPVVSSYQAVEALRIAYQCEQRSGFHVNLDHIALRIVDPKGDPMPANRIGEVVLSNLTNRATVLLNYKLGDLARWCEIPCGCGRTLPALQCIEGRANDLILLPDGRNVHSLIALPPLQAIPGIDRIQLVQQDRSSFFIRCVCSPGASWEAIRRQLDTAARLQLGHDIRLTVRKVETLPKEESGKVRALISNVPRSGI